MLQWCSKCKLSEASLNALRRAGLKYKDFREEALACMEPVKAQLNSIFGSFEAERKANSNFSSSKCRRIRFSLECSYRHY